MISNKFSRKRAKYTVSHKDINFINLVLIIRRSTFVPETIFTFYPSVRTVYATVVADLINRPLILVPSTNSFLVFHANSIASYLLMSISRISLPSSKYLSWTGTNVAVNSAQLILSCLVNNIPVQLINNNSTPFTHCISWVIFSFFLFSINHYLNFWCLRAK